MQSRELVSILAVPTKPFGELVDDVVILGQQLARDVEGDRVRPVLRDGAGKAARRPRQRRVPSRARAVRSSGAAAGPSARPFRPVPCPWSTGGRDSPDEQGRRRCAARPPRAWRSRRSRPRNRRRWCGCTRRPLRPRASACRPAGCALPRPAPRRWGPRPRPALRSPGLQRDDPVVQRAGHGAAVHDALAERAALVRAAVVEREDLVVMVRKSATQPRTVRTTRAPRGGMSSNVPMSTNPVIPPPPGSGPPGARRFARRRPRPAPPRDRAGRLSGRGRTASPGRGVRPDRARCARPPSRGRPCRSTCRAGRDNAHPRGRAG